MKPYQITGNNILLTPLEENSITDFRDLLEDKEFISASLLYNTLYNFTYTSSDLEKKCTSHDFPENNRIYLILETDNQQVIGLTALSDIDWQQRRCEIILIMNEENRKARMAYEPLKLLLNCGINHWNLKCFLIKIYAADTVTAIILKSFGFTECGEIKEYVKEAKDLRDVKIFSLKGQEFRAQEI